MIAGALKFITVFSVLFLIGFGNAVAQDKSIRFEQLTTNEGLSQSTVNDILQDSRGFLWFATEDGLNRYDGYEFKIYRNDALDLFSISSNQITTIIEDQNNTIWVGTRGGGLNRFDREKEQFIRFNHDIEDERSISNNYVTDLYEDEFGIILVATQGGLNVLDPNTNTFSVFSEINENSTLQNAGITSITNDSNNFIWIGTVEDGLYRFDRETGQIRNYTTQNSSISDNWIVTLYEDRSGTLWVGTQSGGLNRFDGVNDRFTNYISVRNNINSISNNWVLSMYEDNRGTFWVGTLNGLNTLDRKTGEFISFMDLDLPINLSNNSVTSLYEDRSGVFWVGTKNGALNKFIRSSSVSFTIFQNDPSIGTSISDNNIWAINEDNEGNIWVGTQGGGLNKLNKSTGGFTSYRHDPDYPMSISDDFINTLFYDSNNNLWVGTINGLNKYDKETGSFVRFKNDKSNVSSLSGDIITTIYEDSGGIIWIGTLNSGLNAYDPSTGEIYRFVHDKKNPNSISHNSIWSIFEDNKGILWVGTHGFGINRYDKVRGTFKVYKNQPENKNSISDNFINVITQDSEGNLWFGTINGLNKFNPKTENFTRYTTKDGLPNNVIYGIIEDYRGHIWLSTNSGITDFDPQSGKVRIYDRGDGLPSDEYRFGAFHKSKDGTIYFGGINGMVMFKPDSIRVNPYIPPVVITDFQIFNKEVPISAIDSPLKKSITETDRIELTWKEEVFSFEFAGLHFASPKQNQYQYIMEGFDQEWQEVGNRRFVSYTNLPPGNTYTFRVKASNKDGLWNEEGKSIEVKILPPPWKSWWAFGSYSIFGFGLLMGFVNYQIGKERKKKEKIEKHNEELEAIVTERTLLLESEKEKSDSLLYNMLPKEIADEIKEKGAVTPKRYEEVTVLFSDFENFTSTAGTMSAKKLVSEVNEIFEAFDDIMGKYNLEKIKTIGDAYMAVSGLPVEHENHAIAVVKAAVEMQHYIKNRNKDAAVKWKMRIGIHTGSVIAGIVGKKKFTYDLWGPTVILASRMEEVGETERINISATTCDQVRDRVECEYRGKINVDGQGDVDMYFVSENIDTSILEMD